MRQMTDLSETPLAALAGDAVIAHSRAIYSGTMILNVGIDPVHARELAEQDDRVLVSFGSESIANPDLVERIRVGASLNLQRPAGYYGASAEGYTDYPFLAGQEPSSFLS